MRRALSRRGNKCPSSLPVGHLLTLRVLRRLPRKSSLFSRVWPAGPLPVTRLGPLDLCCRHFFIEVYDLGLGWCWVGRTAEQQLIFSCYGENSVPTLTPAFAYFHRRPTRVGKPFNIPWSKIDTVRPNPTHHRGFACGSTNGLPILLLMIPHWLTGRPLRTFTRR